jgi:hypothetical protein
VCRTHVCYRVGASRRSPANAGSALLSGRHNEHLLWRERGFVVPRVTPPPFVFEPRQAGIFSALVLRGRFHLLGFPAARRLSRCAQCDCVFRASCGPPRQEPATERSEFGMPFGAHPPRFVCASLFGASRFARLLKDGAQHICFCINTNEHQESRTRKSWKTAGGGSGNAREEFSSPPPLLPSPTPLEPGASQHVQVFLFGPRGDERGNCAWRGGIIRSWQRLGGGAARTHHWSLEPANMSNLFCFGPRGDERGNCASRYEHQACAFACASDGNMYPTRMGAGDEAVFFFGPLCWVGGAGRIPQGSCYGSVSPSATCADRLRVVEMCGPTRVRADCRTAFFFGPLCWVASCRAAAIAA